MGAFGAHGLEGYLAGLEDGVQRLEWWHTAAHYHLIHSVALAVVALIALEPRSGSQSLSGAAFLGGILVFSGSLYAMTLTGVRVLGAITPIGGLLFLVGWATLARAAGSIQDS